MQVQHSVMLPAWHGMGIVYYAVTKILSSHFEVIAISVMWF